jgi:hypothetical protein
MTPRTTLNPGLALKYIEFRAAINFDGFVAKPYTFYNRKSMAPWTM